jgi:hypothetical protein
MLDLQTRVLGNRDMITPSRGGQVKSLGAGEESSKEGSTDSKSTGTGNRLGDG